MKLSTPSSRAPRPSRRLVVALGALAIVVSACSGGPGNQEDLAEALQRDDAFAAPVAECIAERVFLEYGDDEDAIKAISGAPTFDDLDAEGGVPGFTDFYADTVDDCRTSGP